MSHHTRVERLDTTFTPEEEEALGISPPPKTDEEEWFDLDQLLPRIMRDLDTMAALYKMLNFPPRQRDLITSARGSVKAAIRIEAEARRDRLASEAAARGESPPDA